MLLRFLAGHWAVVVRIADMLSYTYVMDAASLRISLYEMVHNIAHVNATVSASKLSNS